MRRATCILLALILLFALSSSCFAEEPGEQSRNYILIIDNSLSTTGSHALGGATDPKGMRFDAARLVYENVLSSAKSGSRGKICVIIFCGPEHCAAYGPMDIGEDAEVLNESIGKMLNESYPHERDGYTDIRTAVETARSILAGFEGDSSVILLTDGINALVNSSDPFHQPINIEANDQTVETIEQIRALGADFCVVALTAQESVSNADAFMEFINRMAAAGGGELTADGSCDNVLIATQTDLNSKLLQILMMSENAEDAGIQTASNASGEKWTFQVPYDGISSETVNITFMPGEMEKIRRITLEAPDKTAFAILEGGELQPVEGIGITSDRSYIILDIPYPQPGAWDLTIDSDGQAEINSVVRFNQNLRICTDMPESTAAGEHFSVLVWVQKFDGEQYVNLSDPDFYELSDASMLLQIPGDSETVRSLKLKKAGDHFAATVILEVPGAWNVDFEVRNDYWSDKHGSTAFEVIPTATGSSSGSGGSGLAPALAPATATVTTEDGGSAFEWQLEADPGTGTMTVSWEDVDGADITAALVDAITGETLREGIRSGDDIALEELGAEKSYQLIATAYSEGAGENSQPITIQKLKIDVIPDPAKIGGALMGVMAGVVQVAPEALSSPEKLVDAANAIKMADDDIEAQAAAASAAGLTGSVVGAGAVGAAGTAAASGSGKSSASQAESQAAAAAAAAAAQSGGKRGLSGSRLVILIAAVVVIALVAVVLFGRKLGGEKMKGRLKITCDPLRLEMRLEFDGRGSIRTGSPLTKHPDIAKLKGGKTYDVLSHVIVSMRQADRLGMVEGSDVQHMPFESLITLSCTDPRTGREEIVHTGRIDAASAVLHVPDAGRVFDVYFSSNMDLR